uniref:Ovule protein n=1 Tax=Gongylonema pulchrum TaxID=637853 RepID=A0A183DF87_9BILA
LRPLLSQQHNLSSMLQLNQVANTTSTVQQDQAEQPHELINDNEEEELIKTRPQKKSRRSSIPELVGVRLHILTFFSVGIISDFLQQSHDCRFFLRKFL